MRPRPGAAAKGLPRKGNLPLPLPVLLATACAIPLIILNFSAWGRMNRSKVAHTLHLDNVHVSEWVHGGHASSSGGRPVAAGSYSQSSGGSAAGASALAGLRDAGSAVSSGGGGGGGLWGTLGGGGGGAAKAREAPKYTTYIPAPATPVTFEPLTPLEIIYPDVFNDTAPTCKPAPRMESLGPPRQMRWIAPPESEEWPVNCQGHEELCEVLRKHAVNREVMAAVANSYAPGLQGFLDAIKKLNIPNFIVIAIDKPLAENLKSQGVPYYFKENAAQGNHKVSAQKFSLLKEFVGVGCSVLLTDTDVVYLQNPFGALYRDADMESMSDGWDHDTAYGWLDPLDDPTMGAQNPARRGFTMRLAALNSGLWWVGATAPSYRVMQIMEYRMATEDLWDQSGYNLELMLNSRDAHMVAGASVRVMSPLCFLNSKVLFRFLRAQPYHKNKQFVPIAVHVNYHSDKGHKMVLTADEYLNNVSGSLDKCVGDGCKIGMEPASVLEAHHRHSINDGMVTSSQFFLSRKEAKQHGCAPRAPWGGAIEGLHHELMRVGGVGAEWALKCPSGQGKDVEELCAAAKQALGGGRDLAVTVVDGPRAELLQTFLDSCKNAGVSNVLVVALDGAAAAAATAASSGVALFQPSQDPPAVFTRAASGKALGPATVKWAVARALLSMGVDVFLMDPDSVLIKNPFDFLYRDCDIEAMTDGWDEQTAWGYDHVVDDPTMGWSRYCHGSRVATKDAGFAFLQATSETVALATRMARRLAGAPDQTALQLSSNRTDSASLEKQYLNGELFFPSHGAYAQVGASIRILNFFCFPNSKGLLQYMRKYPDLQDLDVIATRMSYHMGKAALARGVYEQYKLGKRNAIADAVKSTGGSSEPPPACKMPSNPPPLTEEAKGKVELVKYILNHQNWSWAAATPFTFLSDGKLSTPWGGGTWGPVEDKKYIRDGKPTLWAAVGGALCVLEFEDGGSGEKYGMFISTRCGDQDLVVGRVVYKDSER